MRAVQLSPCCVKRPTGMSQPVRDDGRDPTARARGRRELPRQATLLVLAGSTQLPHRCDFAQRSATASPPCLRRRLVPTTARVTQRQMLVDRPVPPCTMAEGGPPPLAPILATQRPGDEGPLEGLAWGRASLRRLLCVALGAVWKWRIHRASTWWRSDSNAAMEILREAPRQVDPRPSPRLWTAEQGVVWAATAVDTEGMPHGVGTGPHSRRGAKRRWRGRREQVTLGGKYYRHQT